MDKLALIEFIESFHIKPPEPDDNDLDKMIARHWYNAAIFNIVEELQSKLPTIRPEIMAFAEVMEAQMARHDIGEGDSWKVENDDKQRIKRAIKGLYKYKELVDDILPLNMSICITRTCEWLQEQVMGEYKECAARECTTKFRPDNKPGRGQRFCSERCRTREHYLTKHSNLANS